MMILEKAELEVGRCRVYFSKDGGQRIEDGRWRMGDGGWRM